MSISFTPITFAYLNELFEELITIGLMYTEYDISRHMERYSTDTYNNYSKIELPKYKSRQKFNLKTLCSCDIDKMNFVSAYDGFAMDDL